MKPTCSYAQFFDLALHPLNKITKMYTREFGLQCSE